jgi:hypothetical protein
VKKRADSDKRLRQHLGGLRFEVFQQPANACYANDAAKKQAEIDGKCHSESKCESAVRQVKEVLSKKKIGLYLWIL